MLFIKKLILGFGAFILILWGGAGTQSQNVLLQGGGFVGLIIGLVVLYIFVKMAWRAMGCLPSFLIIAGILFFILYAIGAFNNGVTGVGGNLKSFLGQKQGHPVASHQPITENGYALMSADYTEEEMLPPDGLVVPKPAVNQQEPGGIAGVVSTLSEKLGASQTSQNAQTPNMSNMPVIRGSARVISGNMLNFDGHNLVLYGVDAPDIKQTCADRSGRSYRCGQRAASWLRDWILDSQIECRVMQQDPRGNMVGVCSYGPYDLGAAIVNAGWALSFNKYTNIYYPYELQAKENRRGLWSGTFYKPSDWRALQNKQAKIKVIKPKDPKKKSKFDF